MATCPLCKGAGHLLRPDARFTGARKDASAMLVRCNVCGDGQQKEWIRRHCGMEPAEQEIRLLRWKDPNLAPELKAQRARVKTAMISAINGRVGIATFWGDNGSGKTLALQIIVNELRETRAVDGYYAPFVSILNHLRQSYGARDNTSAYWNRLLDVPALAVDEVTRFRIENDWQQEQLFLLLDARYRRRTTHLTMFATNDDPQQALPPERGIGHLYSRMRDGTLFPLQGDVRGAEM